MERKIGEIFEYNGEWYQCVKGDCRKCDFFIKRGWASPRNTVCSKRIRKDKQNVIFKKLEKVGESYTFVAKTVQNYLLETAVSVPPKDVFTLINNEQRLIAIEIKENKEDMEQEIEYLGNESNNAKHSNSEKVGKNLNLFDLEAAKAGKPVCTRDGRKARIICFDKEKDVYPLVVLVSDKDGYEIINLYKANGAHPTIPDNDLMMLPKKKEGWINIYRSEKGEYWSGQLLFSTKKDAIDAHDHAQYVTTVKVEWEE